MAKQKKRTAARKTKSKKVKVTKKSVKRAVGRKARRTAKKATTKTPRKRVSGRKPPQIERMVPVVEGEIIDVVDEPMPGVVRVTEVEATRVTVPGAGDEDEE